MKNSLRRAAHLSVPAALVLFAAGSPLRAAGGEGQGLAEFAARNPRTAFAYTGPGGALERIYGKAFSTGATPKASAQAFIEQNAADVLGVRPADLRLVRLSAEGFDVQPVMIDAATGKAKFFAMYYAQTHAGLPVHGAGLMLLVRNEAGFPLVLANTQTADLRGFVMPAAERIRPAGAAGLADKRPTDEPVLSIVVDEAGAGRLAYVYHVNTGTAASGAGHQRLEVIVDAVTGEEVSTRSRIYTEDVTGNVSGYGTPGLLPDTSYNPPVVMAIPGAQIRIDNVRAALTDHDGNYVADGLDSTPVTVISGMESATLQVKNQRGEDLRIDTGATPPATVDFLHNDLPVDTGTAQVNALIHSTIVRDWQASVNPTYPDLLRPFLATTNNGFVLLRCNANYDGDSINFYLPQGDSCVNSAYSTVVYHEYGHKIIDDGTVSDPASSYHEGMADAITVVLTDQAIIGADFSGPGQHVRDSENLVTYPCTDEAHLCGQIVAGSVWDALKALRVTEPTEGLAIIQSLTLNSILLQPRTISPALTVDFLTLDDDDADILNGTPHYVEIATGFGNHNLDAPTLATMTLTASTLRAGQAGSLQVTGAAPAQRVYFAYSTTGLESTEVASLGVVLALDAPALAGSASADGSGTAGLNVNVPGGTTGRQVWLQAAQTGAVSNVVSKTIQ